MAIKFRVQRQDIPMHIKRPAIQMSVQPAVIVYAEDAKKYDGEYTVEPDWHDQTLETKDKIMVDDMTVKTIHMWEFDNDAGGVTCVIGPED